MVTSKKDKEVFLKKVTIIKAHNWRDYHRVRKSLKVTALIQAGSM